MTAPRLRRLTAAEEPKHPALQRDNRGVVVGAQALLLTRTPEQRAAFLAAFSHLADLAAGVEVEQDQQTGGKPSLLTLTPPASLPDPSRFYDTLQGALDAARLDGTRALLCVGDGRVFAPYYNDKAPHGYDIAGDTSDHGHGQGHGRIVVLPDGAHPLPDITPADTLGALLRVPLRRAPHVPAPVSLSVLTDRRMAPLIASYAHRHGLEYAARFFTWKGPVKQVALFDIVTAAEVRPIPRFVSDFLQRLPRTLLLLDALEPADLALEPPRRILVPWGQQAPFYLPHIQNLLPGSALLILGGSAWGWALIGSPPPRQVLQDLVDVVPPAAAAVEMSAWDTERLRLPLVLQRGRRADGPVHGLLLTAADMQRLRLIVQRMPAALLPRASIAPGDEFALLLADDAHGGLEGLPLGYPLQRSDPHTLLLPRGMHLLPPLAPDLLATTLAITPDALTVLMPGQQYTVPLQAFVPLTRLLTLEADSRRLHIAMQPAPMPRIKLDDLDRQGDRPEDSQKEKQEAPPPQPAPPPRQETPPPQPAPPPRQEAPPPGSASFEQELRQRAAQLERAGDDEIAAAFYIYLKEDARAAACYRRLLRREPS